MSFENEFEQNGIDSVLLLSVDRVVFVKEYLNILNSLSKCIPCQIETKPWQHLVNCTCVLVTCLTLTF